MAAGRAAESSASITHCADLLVKSSDIMHPMTQLMRFIAGYLTWHAGEPQKALEILSSVLDARRKIHWGIQSFYFGELFYLCPTARRQW